MPFMCTYFYQIPFTYMDLKRKDYSLGSRGSAMDIFANNGLRNNSRLCFELLPSLCTLFFIYFYQLLS